MRSSRRMTQVQAELSRAVIGLIVLILSLLLIGFSHYSRELHSSGASHAEGPGDEVVRKKTDFPPVVRRRKALNRRIIRLFSQATRLCFCKILVAADTDSVITEIVE